MNSEPREESFQSEFVDVLITRADAADRQAHLVATATDKSASVRRTGWKHMRTRAALGGSRATRTVGQISVRVSDDPPGATIRALPRLIRFTSNSGEHRSVPFRTKSGCRRALCSSPRYSSSLLIPTLHDQIAVSPNVLSNSLYPSASIQGIK